jgi:muramidase (phage lysozyme)
MMDETSLSLPPVTSKTSKTSKNSKSKTTSRRKKADKPVCPLAVPVQEESSGLWWYLISGSAVMLIAMLMGGMHGVRWQEMIPFNIPALTEPRGAGKPIPLVMKGGDPYIRALMRTISASEASGDRPYSLLYGGEHIANLSSHPDRCMPILTGPNLGNCTTAAGRYQMLTTTWTSKAQAYHPDPPFFPWEGYSFAPEFQDMVTYRWLNDPDAWGADLAQMLKEGKVNEVLRLLSPTWTSLGYGIETNSVSNDLPEIYQQMLQEEMS